MSDKKKTIGCSGYCAVCKTNHLLPQGNAKEKAELLFRELEQKKTVDIFNPLQSPDHQLSTDSLFSEERGKMFGVLECLNREGQTVWLYAFSGQFNTRWSIDGWAPPLFDIPSFKSLHDPVEKQIKIIGREIEQDLTSEEQRKILKIKRRDLSRDLMRTIHRLYKISNFHGTMTNLDQAFLHSGKPTGTGDCCAPKLLNMAAVSGLAPLSLTEFFFGRSNRSESKRHGHFYPSCIDKCQPLLGFMLCGAKQRKKDFEQKS